MTKAYLPDAWLCRSGGGFGLKGFLLRERPNSIAIREVAGIRSMTIFKDAVTGTARRMPAGPHIHPQKNSERKITKNERSSRSPKNRGSMKFDTPI